MCVVVEDVFKYVEVFDVGVYVKVFVDEFVCVSVLFVM